MIAGAVPHARAQGTLRIAMTASDIPLTTGQTDQGGEGMRFMGYTLYDALINWDLSWHAGARHDSARGGTAMNYTYFIQDPFTGFIRHLRCNLAPPGGTNWGFYCDPEMDKLFEQVRTTFDPAEQTKVLQKVHEKYVDEALFLMVTHDVNPRAMSSRVKGFVQAQNWFQDFSPVSLGN